MVALPACRPSMAIPIHEPLPVSVVRSDSPNRKPTHFAVLPSQPGETIPLHPDDAGPTSQQSSAISIEPSPAIEPPKTAAPVVALTPLARSIQDFQQGNADAAIGHLDAMDKPNQELLLQLVPVLVRLSSLNLNRPDAEETASLAKQLESAASQLGKRSKLNVRKAVLCDAVTGFGLYTPVRDAQALLPSTLYVLYVEVGNVPCTAAVRPDGNEWYLTKLECSMQVKDDTGRAIEIVDVNGKMDGKNHRLVQSKSELTRSPIHDYFLRARFDTPSRPGNYTITFEVRDPRSGQSVSKSIGFRVAGEVER